MKKNYTIENWANKFIEKYPTNYVFDFDKSVEEVSKTSFILKKFRKGILHQFYFISIAFCKEDENHQAYNIKYYKYFENVETVPSTNFYIGFVIVDKDLKPLDAQCFKIDTDFF